MPKSQKKKIPEFERGRERGRNEGWLEGYEFFAVVALTVLKDKHDIDNDELKSLWANINKYTELIREGTFRYDLMKKELQDEYGISFRWKTE